VADGERAPPYSRSKAAAQALVLEAAGSGLETVVACPSAVIGPLDFGPSPLGQLVLDLSRGGLPLLINGGCNLVDVRDLTAGIIACGQRGRSGESYLLGGVDVSLATLAALVGETAGRRWRPALPMPVAYLGLPFMAAARWMGADKPLYSADTLWPLRFHRKVSSQKARDELGYATRPISQTVRETVEWFRQRMRDD
jgi:dihydroflavonol-4-reductase